MKKRMFAGCVIAISFFACGLVFADDYEPNDSTADAKLLPSQGVVRGGTLTAGDVDRFRLIPSKTGKLDVRLIARWGPGNADMYVYDRGMNTIAAATSLTDDETIVIPVVEGETYYVDVIEVSVVPTGDYEIYIDTDAVMVPRKPVKETKVTRDVNCTKVGSLLVRADLDRIAAAGIPILTPAQLNDGDPGYAVRVEMLAFSGNYSQTAFAEPVSFSNTLYRLDMSTLNALPEGKYFVTASVVVVDDSEFSNFGSGKRSSALVLNCKYESVPL